MAIQPGPGSTDVSVPDALPVLPLRDAVVFPLTVVPLAVDEPRSIRLIDDVMSQRGIQETRLRELLGHTPVEVLVGAALGIAVGLVPW